MSEAQQADRKAAAGAGVAVLLVIWVFAVPVLAFEGWLKQLSWMGAEPHDPGRGKVLMTLAAILLVLLPATATFIANRAGSGVLAGVMLLLTLGSVFVALLAVVSTHAEKGGEPSVPPRERHCVTMSGGTNTCPGG